MFFFNFDEQPLNLIGVKVVHTGKCKLFSYGEGTIVGQEDKIITVQFKHATKKFEYLKAFTLSLKAVDEKIQYEILAQRLENNSNYGPQTKRVFKAMLDAAKQPMELAVELQAYIATHNVML